MADRAPRGVRRTAPDRASWLWNKDLAAVPREKRSWGTYDYTALWVALGLNIPAYLLAGGLMAGGMSGKQAIGTVFIGSVIVLAPLLLIAHAGAKYGVPFPVFARSSFGVLGANIPAMVRALMACVWFGVVTWFGGEAINTLLAVLVRGWDHRSICVFIFWLINLSVILCGMEAIRYLERSTAPVLLLLALALLGWAYRKAGGFGVLLSAASGFQTRGEFFKFFLPSLDAVVAFWATVALNIPDFTRYAKGQKEQMLGQALGLPATVTFSAFLGVAVTSATVVLFGRAIWDPVLVLAKLGSAPAVILAMMALVLATLNLNLAANLVSPAYGFSNLYPRGISFKMGGLVAATVGGLVFVPWKLGAHSGNYIFGWLGGCASVLGPIAGVLIADYYRVRRTILLTEDLYDRGTFYEFSRGFHWRAVAALLAGVAVALSGLLIPALDFLYSCGWFVGFAVSFLVYRLLMARPAPARDAVS